MPLDRPHRPRRARTAALSALLIGGFGLTLGAHPAGAATVAPAEVAQCRALTRSAVPAPNAVPVRPGHTGTDPQQPGRLVCQLSGSH